MFPLLLRQGAGIISWGSVEKMREKAQSSIEFSIAFVVAILFLILTCNLFVWFNHCLVGRQVAYEETRVVAASPVPLESTDPPGEPGKADFYTRPDLKVFSLGGR